MFVFPNPQVKMTSLGKTHAFIQHSENRIVMYERSPIVIFIKYIETIYLTYLIYFRSFMKVLLMDLKLPTICVM